MFLRIVKRVSPLRFYSSLNYAIISRNNFDENYYLNEANYDEIIRNLKARNRTWLLKMIEDAKEITPEVYENYSHHFPNRLHHRWVDCDPDSLLKTPLEDFVVRSTKRRKIAVRRIKKAESLLKNLDLFFDANHGNLGLYGGKRAYALVGDGAHLQQAILDWAMNELVYNYGFTPVVVPNLVHEEVVEGCGFDPNGQRTQVYKLSGKRGLATDLDNTSPDNCDYVCLAGTSEIPLAALHLGHTFEDTDLPKMYCAVSRCYRSELSELKVESGLYRVHYFTKVEMFALTKKEDSEKMHLKFLEIQEELYQKLGLVYRVVDMPPHELGNSAARKFDIEAWFPSRRQCCEISSTSDCTDYQARRFNIKYRTMDPNYETNEPFRTEFVSTVNGTAVAVPRLMIPLVEFNQTKDGEIVIPEVLRKYMDNKERILKA